jgi:hypothetical protein
MFKKILLIAAMLFAVPAYSEQMDLFSAQYQDEENTPIRLQHVYHHTLGWDRLMLSGINNWDIDDHSDSKRVQIKPRLLLTAYETNGFQFNAVYQYEFFHTATVERNSNRYGAGVKYKYKTFSTEVNYLYDEYEETERWDTYVNYRYGKFGFNNQFWYVPDTERHYEQVTLSYNVWKNVNFQVQRQWLTNADDIWRTGFSMRFK